MRTIALATIFLLMRQAIATAAPAENQPIANPADISSILVSIRKHNAQIPAIWGCVVGADGVVALGVVGVRKSDAVVLATMTDQIHLGSDTKAMTAILIAQQVQSGRLSFATTMGQIFPELRRRMNPAMTAVTVAQLLEHRAGLPHDLQWAQFSGINSLVAQRQRAIEQALAAPPLFPPGSRYMYSNVGYVLLAAVLDRITQHPWEQLIQDQLFSPLHMASAGFGPPGTPGQLDQPWGHTLPLEFPLPIQVDNPPIMNSAGRVHCSIGDWARFITIFLRPPHPSPIVSPATLDALLSPAAGGDYAGGWILTQRKWADGLTMVHSGSNSMWYCVAWLAPRRHFGVLIATNVAGDAQVMQSCDDAASALIRWHLSHHTPP